MGAWADTVLLVETLQGLSPVDWDASTVQEMVDPARVKAAKGTVAPLITARVPSFVAEAGSTEAFLDLAADQTALASEIQSMLGYAYLHHQLSSRAATGRGNRDYERALEFFDPTMHPPGGFLPVAVKAFSLLVPVILSMTTEAAQEASKVPAAVVTTPETKPLTIGGESAAAYSFDIT